MKYFIISGEPSGDLHGSKLIKGIFKSDPKAEIAFWGGDLMEKAGGKLLTHYNELAFMGFIEVLLNIFKILKNFKKCKKDILNFNPDKIIYIDYPGFNLRMCKWAKKRGFRNYYYISPQVWAWKEKRAEYLGSDEFTFGDLEKSISKDPNFLKTFWSIIWIKDSITLSKSLVEEVEKKHRYHKASKRLRKELREGKLGKEGSSFKKIASRKIIND